MTRDDAALRRVLVAEIDTLGARSVTDIVSKLATAFVPAWFTVDAYGRAAPEEAEAARAWLALSNGTRGATAVRVDPRDQLALERAATYAPYSATVEMGRAPGDLILETADGEWIELSLSSHEIEQIGLSIDENRWQSVESQPRKWRKRHQRG